MQFDWSAIWPAIPLLIEGAKMTLWISVLGLAGGLVIGLLAPITSRATIAVINDKDTLS